MATIGTAGDFSILEHYPEIWADVLTVWGKMPKDNIQSPQTLLSIIAGGQGMRAVFDKNGLSSLNNLNSLCKPVKTWWLRDCNFDAAYSGTEFSSLLDCTVPSGAEDTPVTDEYEINDFIHHPKTINAQDCDNPLYGVNLVSNAITQIIKALRSTLATNWANFLVANANPNTWAGTFGTQNVNITEFTDAQFNTDLLIHLRRMAMKNFITDAVIVNGDNLWEQQAKIFAGLCCEDGGAQNIYNQSNVVWDMWLDVAVGSQPTFIFDPSMLGMTNVNIYENPTPTFSHNGANGEQIFGWYVDDPVLNILDINPDTGQQVLRPIRYDFEMSRVCTGRGKMGQFLDQINITGFYKGGRHVAPEGCNGHNGILHIERV